MVSNVFNKELCHQQGRLNNVFELFRTSAGCSLVLANICYFLVFSVLESHCFMPPPMNSNYYHSNYWVNTTCNCCWLKSVDDSLKEKEKKNVDGLFFIKRTWMMAKDCRRNGHIIVNRLFGSVFVNCSCS